MSNVNGLSNVPVTYLDLKSDVKPWLQFNIADSTGDDRLQLITDMACQWVQNYVGRPVGPTTYDRRFDGGAGWEGAFIQLPYYPILEVTSVIEYWGVSGPHVLTEQTPTNQVDGYAVDYQRGELIRVFPGMVRKPWFPGERSVEVVWTAGFNPLPADLKLATLELVNHWWKNTQQQSGLRLGGGNIEYDSPDTMAGLWQGVPHRIEDLLDPYLQVGLA